jgi:hypothetical protein
MAVVNLIQNSFTAGELDPKLRARNDLATFYTGAAKLRNVLPIPQGAVKRRPGLEYLSNVSTAEARMVEFLYSDIYKYILVFEPALVTVFKEGTIVATVSTSITADQLSDLTFSQSNDYLLVFHEDFSPVYILRQDNTTWSTGTWTINNTPSYNFSTAATTNTLTITDGSDVKIDFSTWVTGSTYIGKATAGGNEFAAGNVGDYIRGPLGGYAKITAYTSQTVVSILILAPFTNELSEGDTVIAAGEWTIEEDVFSSTRGYPKCGAFHQGRLWLASTPSLPDGVWASKTNNEEDFGNWIPSFADNGIFLRVRDARAGFHQMIPGKHLGLLSTEGSHYISTANNEPITPTNASVQTMTANVGAKIGIRPYIVSGSTVFMRQGGKSVMEATYSFADGYYLAKDLNLLASHVLTTPIDMAYRKQTSTDESDYLIVINNDGTASVLCMLREQQVTAWSIIETEGRFRGVASDGEDIYFIVSRVFDDATLRYSLERFNENLLLDCAVRNTGIQLTYNSIDLTYLGENMTYEEETKSSISGVGHLIGETVKLITDNTIRSDQEVTSDTLTFPTGVTGEDVQVGFDFPVVDTDTGSQVFIESMPIDIELSGGGTTVGTKKRMSEVTAMLYQTSHLIINSNSVAIRRIGVDTLDTGVPLRTENLSVKGILGWNDEIQVSIGQTLPLPLTLLGMAYKVRG